MNDIDQTALEIARAFIPVDVVSQQRANLQMAIIEAIKKHANPKTLADVQPGGMVRLGDQAERARFEAWAHAQSYRGGNIMADRDSVHPDMYADPIAQLTWKSWQAALSAQPSPGGQDAMADAARRVISDVDSGDYGGTISMATYDALVAALSARQPVGDQHPDDLAVDSFAAAMKAKMAAARAKGRGGWEDPAQCTADDLSRMLREHVEKGDPRDVANFCMMLHQRGEAIAARQPVGEPVAVEVPQGAIINGAAFADRLEHDYQFECPAGPLANCTDYVEFRRCFDFLAQWASSLPPLYAAPTAQAVDLGQFREAIAEWRSNWANYGRTMTSAGRDTSKARRNVDEADRLLALIDSQAVGNGN